MRTTEVIAVALLIVGCGKTQRTGPRAPAPQLNAEESRGAKLFRKFCYQCHPGGTGGLGPSLNEKPLPAVAIRTQIRKGVGAMPAFGSEWMTDDEVAAVAEYVTALHGSPKPR